MQVLETYLKLSHYEFTRAFSFKDIFTVCMHFSEFYVHQNIPHLLPKKMWKMWIISRQKLLIILRKGL